MKNTLIFLIIFFAVVTLSIAQTHELPSDTDALKEKIESIEVSQQQINEKIISEQTAIANEIKKQRILIENMQKQIISATDALKEKIESIEASQQQINEKFISDQTAIANKIKNQKILIKNIRKQILNDTDALNSHIGSLEKSLETNINDHQETLDLLKEGLDGSTKAIQKNYDRLQKNEQATSKQIENLGDSLSKNTLYWIIAVAAIALLSLVLFLLLRIKLNKEKTDLTSQIQRTQKSLEEEAVKLDSKLVELLETQLKLITEERETTLQKSEETDHSLAIKVADEIIRIQKNLSNMSPEIRGLKQLTASVKRIQDNFEANGYELVDMLDKHYDEGMKVSVNFKPDETLEPGEQIITRIIKPQVNYNGVMIQAAQIEVSMNE